MDEKTMFVMKPDSNEKAHLVEGVSKYQAGVVAPIISEGDIIGTVVMVNTEDGNKMGEVEAKLTQSAANFLGRHMEN